MKFAFCIFKYNPYGGLSRNFIRIAQTCQLRGHVIDIYTMKWEGEIPKNFNITYVPHKGMTNHSRVASYVQNLQHILKNKSYDAIVGFNRMPGLDVFYAADVCYEHDIRHRHGCIYRLTKRYKTYSAFERAIFAPEAKTDIMLISDNEKQHFIEIYGTPENRLHLLPPGINRKCMAPDNAEDIRKTFRSQHHISDQQKLILLIGSNFQLKGVDRALDAIAALPAETKSNVLFWVIGQGKKAPYLKQAQKLGLREQFKFLGTTDQIPKMLLAADLLIHPARREAAGMVLLEAIIAGLPVLTTDVCGFAPHIEKADAGLLVPSPFNQETLNQDLLRMLTSGEYTKWHQNGIEYGKTQDLYSRAEKAADIIEGAASFQLTSPNP